MLKDYQKIELLAPAGSYETFQAVLSAGADAVYVGGSSFGARAYANNFSQEELLKAIDYAHIHDKKLYLTVNTLLKEKELYEQLYDYLLPYYTQGLDAVIVQDIGALQLIKEAFPKLDIHTSTQMTVTNAYGAQMMKDLGAKRVVTARELSFAEIKNISDNVAIEIESFVHGALCYCYSGQCLFSSMIGGRSGNRGRCAQPCRLPYEVYQKDQILLNDKKPYVLSPKDLCTIEWIPKLVESGIYSFKIEGRMKQTDYAAGVVSMYRKYIDSYFEDTAATFRVSKEDQKKLFDFGNRCGFTDGFYQKHNGADMITFQAPSHKKNQEETYLWPEKKEKINGKLILSLNKPAKMSIHFGDITVEVEGEQVFAAQKQPLTEEKVKENICKTGNTAFSFERLDLQMDDAIFMPMKAINQIRRDALEKLEEAILTKYRRKEEERTAQISSKNESNVQKTSPFYVASIEQRKQLKPLLRCEILQEVYLDSICYERELLLKELAEDCESLHQSGKKAYYIFPSVFRMETACFYEQILQRFLALPIDGIVVKNYDALQFVKQHMPHWKIIMDHNLYTYNSKAIEVLKSYEPLRMTAPFELNKKELKHRKNENSELVIYGRIPLMTSASCTMKSTIGCQKESGISYIKDRYEKIFPVCRNCNECYNVIYNSVPISLFPVLEEVKELGFAAFRLSFTIENEKRISDILMKLQHPQMQWNEDATYGHYKRGVE